MGRSISSWPEECTIDTDRMTRLVQELLIIVYLNVTRALVDHGVDERLVQTRTADILGLNAAVSFVQHVHKIVTSAQKDLLEFGCGAIVSRIAADSIRLIDQTQQAYQNSQARMF